MNEHLFLNGCPIIRPEGIYLDGARVISLGLRGVGLGDVGDLLAYRQAWEPFIDGHLQLWRRVNELLERAPTAQKCPAGIFDVTQLSQLGSTERAFCASLSLSRMRVSDTHPTGIRPQWNAWSGKSSSEILEGAKDMLEWHQAVVMRVGGAYKDELLQIGALWGIPIELPDVPEFTFQQEIRARIEAAYISAKGVLQIVGYGIGQTLVLAADVTEATAEGLSATARKLPQAVPTPGTWVGIAAVVAVVGGALLVYYHPRKVNAGAAAA